MFAAGTIGDSVVPLPGLRRIRTLAALTQQQLADRARVQRQTIIRLEQGGEAEMPTVARLADALNVEPRELIEPER
jgi:transcriptional regulator with XRE-family HTH domain